jgi:N,N'-diacetylchitobiose transport system permease protein
VDDEAASPAGVSRRRARRQPPENLTPPVWLRSFKQVNSGTDWGAIMTGSTLMTIPVIVFFLFVQGRMTTGLVSGAVKG